MALLIASIAAPTGDAMQAQARQALADGADLVEFRLDALDEVDPSLVEWAAARLPGRVIATCRTATEGGASDATPDQRLALLAPFAERGVRIDFEWEAARHVPDFRSRIFAWQPPEEHHHVAKLILSTHDFSGRPTDPRGVLQDIQRQPNVIPKLAWMTDDIGDNLIALELMRTARVTSIIICMGTAGLMSRILAPKVGGFATYCSPNAGRETAPGQLSLDDMRDLYRWESIDAETRVLGVIGWPVDHSMSPLIHNGAFGRAGINAVYLPLAVDPGSDTLERFLDGCLEHDWLHTTGFSVTVPHKQRVLPYLEDYVDERAKRIGAVNTLVVAGDHYEGHNTDYHGALASLTNGMQCTPDDLSGQRALVLGAGGAARAVVAALRDHGADVRVCGRTASAAERVAHEFDCRAIPWDRRTREDGQVLVNCTSVGMGRAVEDSPLPGACTRRFETVFDVVYNPIRTRLIRDAEAAGCRIITGVEMFVRQAAEQFRAWTGRTPDVDAMRQQVVEELTRHA